MAFENNYTLGTGRLYFARKDPITGVLGGERYIGNTPEFSVTNEEERLEHRSSDRPGRPKDKSITLQTNRTATFTTDNISPSNLALFFFGTAEALTVAAATVTGETIGAVEKGMFYQLGHTAANPSGARNIVFPGTGATVFSVNKTGSPLVAGVDYLLDAARGRVEILETSATVEEGDELTVAYSVAASNRTRIISGSSAIEGSLRYVGDNSEGDNHDYYMASVSLSPNGDYALKAEEWQTIPFTVDILEAEDVPAVVIDAHGIAPS